MDEARDYIETWRLDYNDVRPRSALGYPHPRGFSQKWTLKTRLIVGTNSGESQVQQSGFSRTAEINNWGQF